MMYESSISTVVVKSSSRRSHFTSTGNPRPGLGSLLRADSLVWLRSAFYAGVLPLLAEQLEVKFPHLRDYCLRKESGQTDFAHSLTGSQSYVADDVLDFFSKLRSGVKLRGFVTTGPISECAFQFHNRNTGATLTWVHTP